MNRTITLKNSISEAARLVDIIEEYGKEYSISGKSLYNIKLALEELFVNIVLYGYDDDGEHEVTIVITKDGSELTVEIRDDGKPFNPLEAPAPDLEMPVEEREPGGLGIHLVRHISKGIEYRREGAHNILVLRLSA